VREHNFLARSGALPLLRTALGNLLVETGVDSTLRDYQSNSAVDLDWMAGLLCAADLVHTAWTPMVVPLDADCFVFAGSF
jgi:hypothetical protein